MADKKIVLVVGASSGFGELVSEKLLHLGYTVYAAARRVEKMKKIEALGGHPLKMDVTDEASVRAGVERIIAEKGRIDILLNNAGYGSYGMAECVPMVEAQHQFDTNVFGMGRVLQAVLPHMRAQKSGRIIITTSLVAHVSTVGIGWYAASKHALRALTDALRQEVKGLGISVSMIEPGIVKTEFDSVALDTMDKIDYPEDYKDIASGFRAVVEDSYVSCPGPESTVRAMVKAATAKYPKARYRTTADSKLYSTVKYLVSTRLFDAMVMFTFFRKKK